MPTASSQSRIERERDIECLLPMAKILLGLDIGIQSIKAVQISCDKSSRSLLSAGFIATPAKALTGNDPKDDQIIANTVNRLVHDMKISSADVSASLPSGKVITRVIDVPDMTEDELASSIEWEAEQYIPLPLSKVKIDYAIINKNAESNKMKILLVAAPITIIERYMHIISLAGLTPVALETEIMADCRSINTSFPDLKNELVLTIGATNSIIALLHERVLVYTHSYPVGGNTLTKAIAEELGFEVPQAEEYKKTYGLDTDKLEGKIAKTLTPYLTNIIEEMQKTIVYFKEQYPNDELKNVIICGGSAKLPGLILTITKSIGLDSQINNPFINLAVDPNILPTLSPEAPVYSTAVGLALKEIS